MKQNKGITLIALVITIIVLLILAGVTISTLTGENGILTRASEASEETLIANEKEEISVAYNGAKAKNLGEKITDSDLNEQFSVNGTNAEANGSENIVVKFLESNNEYIIQENGNITEVNVEQVKDSNPGSFEGNGTDANPYLIQSIEDLVAFATNVNAGETYTGKYFELTQDLDFYSDKSYVNKDTKYAYNSTKDGYEENSEGQAIKQLCTTGEGFISIGRADEYFEGFFEGNNCTIHNLYINIDREVTGGRVGLFGGIDNDSEIRNVSVNGQITVLDSSVTHVGGITGEAQCGGQSRAKIINCNADVDIMCHADCVLGGIVGGAWGTIENCNHNGNIIVEAEKEYVYVGGIAGIIGSSVQDEVINCNNYGSIKVNTKGANSVWDTVIAGIAGYNNEANIQNCINEANIEVLATSGICVVGGITGYNDTASDKIVAVTGCLNKGNVKGTSEQSDCYVAGVSGYSEMLIEADDSTNEGTIEAIAENGTAYKDDIVAKVEE